MVKINLMNIPEEGKKPDQQTPGASEEAAASPREKMDFSFFEPDEEPVSAEPAPETASAPSEAPIDEDSSPFQGGEEEILDEDLDYESSFPRTRLFIFIGIGAVLILGALFLIYKLYRPAASEPAAIEQPIQSAPAEEENLTAAPIETPSIPPALQARYQQNMAQNSEGVRLARGFLSSRSNNADHTLLVLTSGQMLASVLADSRDDIARYRQTIKSRFPNLQLNIETIEDKFVDGRKKLLAGFSIPVNLSGGKASPPAAAPLTFNDFQARFRALQNKHGIKSTYRKVGERSPQRGLNTTNFYTIVTGSRTAMMSFLQDITGEFPGMKINKLSIYPSGAASISDGPVNARLEIAYSAPQS